MDKDALVVKNNTPVGRRNRFDEYNMHEDIKNGDMKVIVLKNN